MSFSIILFTSVTLPQLVHIIWDFSLPKHFSYFDALPKRWCMTRFAFMSNVMVLYTVALLTQNFSSSSFFNSSAMSKFPFIEYMASSMANLSGVCLHLFSFKYSVKICLAVFAFLLLSIFLLLLQSYLFFII